jgi:hypothetical protein
MGKKKTKGPRVEEALFDASGALYARRVYGDDTEEQSFLDAKGKPIATLTGLFSHAFHPKTRRLAFEIHEGDDAYVLFDDRRVGPFDAVQNLAFSEDGSRVTFTSRRGADLAWNVL